MNAVGASLLLLLLLLVLFASRRVALLGMMAGVLYLTQGQQIVVFGFNLYAMRFLELAGFLRVLLRKEIVFRNLNAIDRSLILLCAYTAIVYGFRSSENRALMLAGSVDSLCCYFAFRGLVGNLEDFRRFLHSFVFLLFPFVLLVAMERITHRSPFAFMGGIVDWEWLREGKLRCSGSFRHPSLLGGFAASFLALYVGLAHNRDERKIAGLGIGLCLALVLASNSGGPKVAALFVAVGWTLWRVRTRMRHFRWAMVSGILVLALVMKAPVWYLPSHFTFLGGDTWHRCYLIDVAFQHLPDWWFTGMPLSETSGWFPYDLVSTGGADITNQFLYFGIHAGFVAMSLFVLLLVLAYKRLGLTLSAARSARAGPDETEFLLWGMGVMLAVHIANWWGISYWDQTYVVWFMHLAAVSNVSDSLIAHPESQAGEFGVAQEGVPEPNFSSVKAC